MPSPVLAFARLDYTPAHDPLNPATLASACKRPCEQPRRRRRGPNPADATRTDRSWRLPGLWCAPMSRRLLVLLVILSGGCIASASVRFPPDVAQALAEHPMRRLETQ